MQRSFCLYIHTSTALAVPTRYIRQRGVFVSQFILFKVFADTGYVMSATSLYAFLVSVNQCVINADFGGLVSKVKVFVMNRESLRRVSYYTENPNQGFDPERENDPIAKEGYFHTWSTTPWPNPHGKDDYYNRAVAIIEEEAGNLIEVPTDWITFIS